MTNKEYIDKWLEGTLSESERESFEKTKDFESLEKLDRHLQRFKAPAYRAENEYAKLSEKLSGNNISPETKVVSLNWLRPLLKVAAVVLLAVVGYILYGNYSTVQFRSEMAQQKELFLPDSSLVTLNASSAISYKVLNWQNDRSLKLEGEAFFEVAKGSKFDVETKSGIVTVTGTKFNVVSRGEYFEVVCYEGSVQVQVGEQTEKITAGLMLTSLNGHAIISKVKRLNKPSWMLHESTFVSIPFSYVLDELERQYNIAIQTKSVDETLLFTGSFVHDDLDLALKATTGPLGLTYTIQGDEVILTSED